MLYAFLLKALLVAKATTDEIASFGFQYLGSGMSRKGYLGPNGNVFKVANYVSANEAEYSLWKAWQTVELPFWVCIPHMQLHDNGVLECEFMGEDALVLDYWRFRELRRIGFWDIHENNVRELSDRRIAVIDLGGSIPY